MSYVLLMVIAFIMGFAGEILCKIASANTGLTQYACQLGAFLCWGSGAFTWTMIYRQKLMSEAIAIYNPTQILLLVTSSVLFFNEPFTWRLVVAYGLVGIIFWILK